MFLRHLLAIVILPITVTIVVPIWIVDRYGVAVLAPTSVRDALAIMVGVAVLLGGLALFTACLRRFATEGRGTLAPWDPPRALVVNGPYRYVRHPMISAVILVLIGEALGLRSVPHALWAALFVGMNLVYVPLLEEPLLERRFGPRYREYRRHVPALVPRLRPWRGEET